MDLLVQQGKVLYVGSSNFAGWHLVSAMEAARKRGLLGLVSEQSLYNLAVRDIELEVLPAARAEGIGVIPWSPLQGGLLSGILKRTDTARSTAGRSKDTLDGKRDQVERYEALCDELGIAPSVVALAWLLHQEGVTAPIIGPRTMEQLTSALAAVDLALDEKTLLSLDEIFPPKGPAPEAYAW
jgi:aryl-alcohol dehydrogenase-like predicted oxidoreductase